MMDDPGFVCMCIPSSVEVCLVIVRFLTMCLCGEKEDGTSGWSIGVFKQNDFRLVNAVYAFVSTRIK